MVIGMASAGIQLLLQIDMVSHALAQTPTLIPVTLSGCDFLTGKIDANCVPLYIAYLIATIFKLTGAIFLLMIILGGYQYVISKATGGGGDEGKARVRFAIVGFLVTALSFYIVDFILASFIP